MRSEYRLAQKQMINYVFRYILYLCRCVGLSFSPLLHITVIVGIFIYYAKCQYRVQREHSASDIIQTKTFKNIQTRGVKN